MIDEEAKKNKKKKKITTEKQKIKKNMPKNNDAIAYSYDVENFNQTTSKKI